MPKFQLKSSQISAPTLNVMVGVAGHIDHGKTELVKMLTGCETDRLKEEKERGMSIEVGYAPCFVESGRFGIVDVPGHERFVRKMVAGATGIDAALLVIAADDGVMPQTREHLDILELLGIRHLLIALNKIDLVSPERIKEAQEEIRHFMQDTSFPDAAIIPVSAWTGDGLDRLRARLREIVEGVERRKSNGVFRLPVDRVFSSQGHGTIVTGITMSGMVRVGDTVEIHPLGKIARVRGMQVYLSDSEESVAGQCVALNLAGIRPDEVERGFVVAAPDRFVPLNLVTVRLRASRFLEEGISNSARIHFYSGTSETPGKIRLLENENLEAGEETFAQILLEKPVCVFLRDRFILRIPSPARTIAGGMVIDCRNIRLRRKQADILDSLQERWHSMDSNEDLLLSLLHDFPGFRKSIEELSRMSGFTLEETRQTVESLRQRGNTIDQQGEFITTLRGFQKTREAALRALHVLHQKQPFRFAFASSDISRELNEETALLADALNSLIQEGRVQCNEDLYRATDAPPLDPKFADLTERLEKLIWQERFQTTSFRQWADSLRAPLAQTEAALRVLVESGRVRRLAENIYLHEEHVQWARERLVEEIRRTGSFETHLFKNMIGSSRKYAIPLLDYFDATGLTRREGGVRVLSESSGFGKKNERD